MQLSIIIVNWNSTEPLSVCLSSLFNADLNTNFEVIVVDNASYDGCREMLLNHFPTVQYVQCTENLGFARANNLGSAYAKGKVLLFLNPDTKIVGDAIQSMMGVFSKYPDAGIVGCRLLNEDLTIQTSCVQAFPRVFNETLDSEVLRSAFPRSSLWGTAALMEPKSTTTPVECVSGACLMIRHDVFDQVGMFSPEYFMYVEDRDLCYKVFEAGLKTYFNNAAEVVHFGGNSSDARSESQFSTLMRQQSLLTFMSQRHGRWRARIYRIAMCINATSRLCLIGTVHIGELLGLRIPARNSFKKWYCVLRWSLGMESWTARQI